MKCEIQKIQNDRHIKLGKYDIFKFTTKYSHVVYQNYNISHFVPQLALNCRVQNDCHINQEILTFQNVPLNIFRYYIKRKLINYKDYDTYSTP